MRLPQIHAALVKGYTPLGPIALEGKSSLRPGWNERLKGHPWTVGALLALFTVVSYWGALRNSFVSDDESQINANPFVLNPHLWTKIFTGTVWSFNSASARDNYYRPLQIFWYWLVYRVGGPNPGLFHVLQILVYAATAWLVYRLGCEIFGHECAALAGAGLWILHPLHVEAVAWIAGMADVGCGFFFLLAFLLFVRAEKTETPNLQSHLLPALVYFPALFFKEMAVCFPLLALAYWFFFSPSSSAGGARDWAGRLVRSVPYFVAVGAYIAIRLAVVGSFGRTRSLWKISAETLVSGIALLGQNARLFVLPLGLNPSRPFDLGPMLRSPWPWAALLGMAFAFWFRKRDAQLTFLVVWWAVTLVPCLDIRQLGIPKVADRFSYVPSVGLCLAIALTVLVRLPAWSSAGPRLMRLVAPAMGLLAVFWASQTLLDIPHWRNNEALMKQVQANAPNAAWLHLAKGDILRFQKGDLNASKREYQTALVLSQDPKARFFQVTYDSYIGLGWIAQMRGHDQQALKYYQQAADVFPQLSPAFDSLGAFYFPRKDYATASLYFSKAVQANPQDVVARIYLGSCWMKLGKFKEAAEEFHAARIVDPSLKVAYMSEARALDALGEGEAAAKVRASFH